MKSYMDYDIRYGGYKINENGKFYCIFIGTREEAEEYCQHQTKAWGDTYEISGLSVKIATIERH